MVPRAFLNEKADPSANDSSSCNLLPHIGMWIWERDEDTDAKKSKFFFIKETFVKAVISQTLKIYFSS